MFRQPKISLPLHVQPNNTGQLPKRRRLSIFFSQTAGGFPRLGLSFQRTILALIFLLVWSVLVFCITKATIVQRLSVYNGYNLTGISSTRPPNTLLSHLIIVPGHAIWRGVGTGKEDSDWVLEPYQKNQGISFLNHIKAGVQLSIHDTSSLLVFSGGQTRESAGPISEAQSYWELASTNISPHNFDRMTTEEFGRDSYENVLFSVCRFYEVAGNYPAKITVIGHEFKRERFIEVHREAIKFPRERYIFFHYIYFYFI